MAVTHGAGAYMTARDAGTQQNSLVTRSPLYEAVDRLVPTGDPDATSILRLVRVPSNARLSSLEVAFDAATLVGDLGIYYANGHNPVEAQNASTNGTGTFGTGKATTVVGNTAADGGGAAIDKQFLGTTLTFLAAGYTSFDGTTTANGQVDVSTDVVKTNLLDSTINASKMTIAKSMQPLWQAIGCTSDPGGEFDIAITVTTNSANLANIATRARYTL